MIIVKRDLLFQGAPSSKLTSFFVVFVEAEAHIMKPNGKGEGCHIAIIAILVSVVVTLPLTGEANKTNKCLTFKRLQTLKYIG